MLLSASPSIGSALTSALGAPLECGGFRIDARDGVRRHRERGSRTAAHRNSADRDGDPFRLGPSMRRRATGSSLRQSPACFGGSSRVGKDFPRLHPLRRLRPSTSTSGDALTGRRKRDLVSPASDAEVLPDHTPVPGRSKLFLGLVRSRALRGAERLAPRSSRRRASSARVPERSRTPRRACGTARGRWIPVATP